MIQRAIYCNTNTNEKIISGANIRHFQRKCLTGLLENRLPLGSTQYNTHPLENVSFRSYFLGLKDVLGILALVQHAILATDRSDKANPLPLLCSLPQALAIRELSHSVTWHSFVACTLATQKLYHVPQKVQILHLQPSWV